MNTFTLTLAFIDPNLDSEERETLVQRVLRELRDMDEVETVGRVPDLNPPEGSKAFAGFLAGLLMAEVSTANSKKLLRFLGQRLSNQPIELSLEAHGKKLTVKASSQEEFAFAMQQAQVFLDGAGDRG
ncbi:MAG: hypothetical protein WBG32_21865 [Nodosilinea sp.]